MKKCAAFLKTNYGKKTQKHLEHKCQNKQVLAFVSTE
jgi:hypothetical protein